MSNKRRFSSEEARALGTQLGIDWTKINMEQFRRGLEVEMEHGTSDPETNVTGDDLALTGKIAWAHLKEIKDYYTRLDRLEAEAEAQPGVEDQPVTDGYLLKAEPEAHSTDGYLSIAHESATETQPDGYLLEAEPEAHETIGYLNIAP